MLLGNDRPQPATTAGAVADRAEGFWTSRAAHLPPRGLWAARGPLRSSVWIVIQVERRRHLGLSAHLRFRARTARLVSLEGQSIAGLGRRLRVRGCEMDPPVWCAIGVVARFFRRRVRA